MSEASEELLSSFQAEPNEILSVWSLTTVTTQSSESFPPELLWLNHILGHRFAVMKEMALRQIHSNLADMGSIFAGRFLSSFAGKRLLLPIDAARHHHSWLFVCVDYRNDLSSLIERGAMVATPPLPSLVTHLYNELTHIVADMFQTRYFDALLAFPQWPKEPCDYLYARQPCPQPDKAEAATEETLLVPATVPQEPFAFGGLTPSSVCFDSHSAVRLRDIVARWLEKPVDVPDGPPTTLRNATSPTRSTQKEVKRFIFDQHLASADAPYLSPELNAALRDIEDARAKGSGASIATHAKFSQALVPATDLWSIGAILLETMLCSFETSGQPQTALPGSPTSKPTGRSHNPFVKHRNSPKCAEDATECYRMLLAVSDALRRGISEQELEHMRDRDVADTVKYLIEHYPQDLLLQVAQLLTEDPTMRWGTFLDSIGVEHSAGETAAETVRAMLTTAPISLDLPSSTYVAAKDSGSSKQPSREQQLAATYQDWKTVVERGAVLESGSVTVRESRQSAVWLGLSHILASPARRCIADDDPSLSACRSCGIGMRMPSPLVSAVEHLVVGGVQGMMIHGTTGTVSLKQRPTTPLHAVRYGVVFSDAVTFFSPCVTATAMSPSSSNSDVPTSPALRTAATSVPTTSPMGAIPHAAEVGSPAQRGDGGKTAALRTLLLSSRSRGAMRDAVVSSVRVFGGCVPAVLRCEVWGALLQVEQSAALRETAYRSIDVCAATCNDRQIAVDIPRCHQYHPAISAPEGHDKLLRLLKAWVVHRASWSYWQGLDSVCAAVLSVSYHDEALAFACFDAIVNNYVPHFFSSSPIEHKLVVFTHVLQYHDPVLCLHLQRTHYVPELYAISWFLTLFAHVLPLAKVCRVWDELFLTGEPNFLVCVAVAVVEQRREQLLEGNEFCSNAAILSNLHTISIEPVIVEAKRIYRSTPSSILAPNMSAKFSSEVKTSPCAMISAQDILDASKDCRRHAIGSCCGAQTPSQEAVEWNRHGLFLLDVRAPQDTAPPEAASTEQSTPNGLQQSAAAPLHSSSPALTNLQTSNSSINHSGHEDPLPSSIIGAYSIPYYDVTGEGEVVLDAERARTVLTEEHWDRMLLPPWGSSDNNALKGDARAGVSGGPVIVVAEWGDSQLAQRMCVQLIRNGFPYVCGLLGGQRELLKCPGFTCSDGDDDDGDPLHPAL